MKIPAIETAYKGYRFRSRLEAKWAVFFDALGLKWEYEPEGYVLPNGEWYLPDFHLPGMNLWVEVKGAAPTAGERKKAWELSRGLNTFVTIVSELPVCDEGAEFVPLSMAYGPFVAVHDTDDGGSARCTSFYYDKFRSDPWSHTDGPFEWGQNLEVNGFPSWAMDMAQANQEYAIRVDAAARTARSARFEHGETPQ
jgi:hypothetical protein